MCDCICCLSAVLLQTRHMATPLWSEGNKGIGDGNLQVTRLMQRRGGSSQGGPAAPDLVVAQGEGPTRHTFCSAPTMLQQPGAMPMHHRLIPACRYVPVAVCLASSALGLADSARHVYV